MKLYSKKDSTFKDKVEGITSDLERDVKQHINTTHSTTSITISETEVYSGNAPVAWTDLDLSGTIGADSVLVLLKVSYTENAAAIKVAFRKNGDTDEFYMTNNQPYGCACAEVEKDKHTVFTAVTDTAGVVEWIAEAARTGTTVDVMAYIK